ncbi:MAG TPA: hypothetical protein VM261_25810 [Kofleriaceae bacterium]|nr:hypothetical protein [Kofleriaceae bacterium]
MARIPRLTFLTITAALFACGGKPAPAKPAEPPPPPPVADPTGEQPAATIADDPPPPEPEEEPEPPAAPPEPVTQTFKPKPPKVELLAKGKGKREKLRYQAAVGDPFECTLVMDMKVVGQVTIAVPTTTMSWTGKVTLAEKRRITAKATIDVLDVAAGADPMSDNVGREMRAKLGPMLNGTMESTTTDAGIPVETTFTSLGQLDPQTLMGMQSGAGGGLVVPEQPIGVGARWRVTRVDDNGLVVTTSIATFELVERKGDSSTIRGAIEVIGTSSLAAPVKGSGTSEATFTGALCAPSKVTTATNLTEPMPMTIEMTMETRARTAP